MNRFYNTGFISVEQKDARLKQGLPQQTVASVCQKLDIKCNQKSLYPVQQVQMEVPSIPEVCDSSLYIMSP